MTQFKSPTLLVVAALAGCGGGGGDGGSILPDAISAPVAIRVDQPVPTISLGKSFVLKGSAVSQPNAMASMKWTVEKLVAGAPEMTLANGDCAASNKSGTTVNGITRSTWTCDALLTAPTSLTVSATYRITFTGVDVKGNTGTGFKDVTIGGGGSVTATPPPTATVQSTLTVNAGADVALNCLGAGGRVSSPGAYIYSWVVKANPSGVPFELSPKKETLNFKAPDVKEATTVTLQCRVVDDNLALGSADSVVSIRPPVPLPAAPFVIANAGPVQSVSHNSVVTLDASASKAKDGQQLYYYWEQFTGPLVSFSDGRAVKPTFVAPTVSEVTALTFRVYASVEPTINISSIPPSQVAVTTVYVDPKEPISLKITPAMTVLANTPVNLSVTVTPTGEPYYYAWSQVYGPSVILGAANTQNASFISPDVGTPWDLVFVVSVSRKPLHLALPGEIVTTDVVVRTNPAP